MWYDRKYLGAGVTKMAHTYALPLGYFQGALLMSSPGQHWPSVFVCVKTMASSMFLKGLRDFLVEFFVYVCLPKRNSILAIDPDDAVHGCMCDVTEE